MRSVPAIMRRFRLMLPMAVALGLAVSEASAGITVSAAFAPATISLGAGSTLTVTIDNNPPPGSTGSISFTSSYPANLVNAAAPAASSSCGGTVTAAPGGTSLSFSGGSLNGNQVCTVSVTVTSSVAGTYPVSTGTVTTTNAGTGAAANATLVVTGGMVAPAGFNAFETTTPAGSTTGVIRTKVAASPFSLAVVALKSGGSAVETAFVGDVRLELVNASTGATCAAHPLVRNLGMLTFAASDQGRKTATGINEPEAWQNVRVRVSYPATGAPSLVACSTDNFAIRPASFGSVAATDATSSTAGTARTLDNVAATGGVVHRAGRPFQLAATALNAAGSATANYAGSPAASATGCVLPASCTLGTFTAGPWTAAGGTVTTLGASYSEVGAINARLVDTSFAAVDAADSSLVERSIESAVVAIGRFVPDHFELTTASTPVFKTFNDTTCATRSFTYVGQPFAYVTLPQATITAKNATGGTTVNYAGTLWKLGPAGSIQSYTAVSGALDIGLLGAPTIAESGSGTGSMTANAADQIAFVRAMPVAPFMADISLSMSVQDIAETGVADNGIIDTATPALFASIGFDAGNEIRYGRLVLTNAHGSELLTLPVPIETQYWTGSAFARNTADACTQFTAANVALSNWRRDLNACETSVLLSGRFVGGRGNLRLTAPGAGNTGSVDLTLQLGATASGTGCVGGAATAATPAAQSWLQGAWTGGAYDQNPSARASFGLNRGSKPLIYLREMY